MINPKEAPEGDVAVARQSKAWLCKGCKYLNENTGCERLSAVSCFSTLRRDKQEVIFVDKISPTENGGQDLIWIDEANDLARLPISEEIEALAKQYLAEFDEDPDEAEYQINNFLKWVKENGKA